MTERIALSRRRFLSIAAATAGVGLLPSGASAARPLVWRGTALGAEASLTLYHPDETVARRVLTAALAEVRRLEGVFSLYREDSAVSRLNGDGALAAPPLELVQLLGQARNVSALTDGAFDVTVQPLWRLYADHFAAPEADPGGPPPAALAGALDLVDYRAVEVASDEIAFARAGMAITLNGIAQGYITDRVADLLRAEGLTQVLIDLGEIRPLGRHPKGRPWRAGIADPRGGAALLHEVALDGRALATSAGSGTTFEPSGRFHHLLDPRSGRSMEGFASVSVLAPRASLADGLSTGFGGLTDEGILAVCKQLPEIAAITLDLDGRLRRLQADGIEEMPMDRANG